MNLRLKVVTFLAMKYFGTIPLQTIEFELFENDLE